MPDRHYDVIIIGRSLGALVAGALLARRDFTVLLIGQRQLGADYRLGEHVLRRRAFTMLAATSPVWRRILGELAQTQTWKRRVAPVVPMLQVLMPGRRFEVPPDAELFRREVEREFPHARRLMADLYSDFARVTAAADAAFERDALWPPGKFFERRETGRVAATLPYARAEPHADLLAEFPLGHSYRRIVTESVRFATDLAGMPPAFAVARLHGAWTRGLVGLRGGEAELEQLLLERISANGGRFLLADKADGLVLRRGVAAGVHIDGDTGMTGASFVLTDMTGEELAALTGGQGITKRAQREWPRISPLVGRFVVSLIVRREGVPQPLGKEVLVVSGASDKHQPDRVIHLQLAETAKPDELLLIAEMLRPAHERGAIPLQSARQHIVQQLCQELPFLERHLVIVDSVHDGLPLWRYEPDGSGAGLRRRDIDRTELEGLGSPFEPMAQQLEVDPPGYLGLAGEPIRGPIEHTLLVGPSVMPGLGQEGRLLAACGAARLVTKSDKRKARMRREMWTKMEIS